MKLGRDDEVAVDLWHGSLFDQAADVLVEAGAFDDEAPLDEAELLDEAEPLEAESPLEPLSEEPLLVDALAALSPEPLPELVDRLSVR